ncbi:uncharacterized protein LOC131595077 [Vicia villosa]|uniref:uncharacterized protein LOC131595077 n=1 Tax=Vicia villosa TaxID=3911 RepID=UPI00273C94BE|nr:uncharacterized protein LOC131595077 [Vicia villosa]
MGHAGCQKCIRQGDPISPLLFVLIMEYLHRYLGTLNSNSEFHYHPKCKKLKITHICFADDLLLFSRGDVESVKGLMQKFNEFSAATGLKANPSKCRIYFGGTSVIDQANIKEVTSYGLGQLPFKYLGVPLSSRKLTIHQCQPLIDRMLAKIQHWSTKFLSYAGRTQLVQSTLLAITNYWTQVFPLPKKIIHRVEALCKNFLWSGKATGKRALVAWDKVCDPHNAGGLNITALDCWNKATFAKLLWNLHKKEDKLWIRWLDAYYMKGVDIMQWQMKQDCSWIFKSIMKKRDMIRCSPYWMKSLNDNSFSTRKMYTELRGDRADMNWRKLFYQNYARPRARFILWLTVLGRIPTKDRLGRIGIHTDGKCSACDQPETVLHLFFDCSFTQQIWTKVLTWLGYQIQRRDWSREWQWIMEETAKKGWKRCLLKMVVAETIYHVWQYRNERVFGNTNQTMNIDERIKIMVMIRGQHKRKLAEHLDVEHMLIK